MDKIIRNVNAEYYQIPLHQPLVDAEHGPQTHFEIIIARIMLDDGCEGVGYTYTGGFGGKAIYHMILQDLAPVIIGKKASAVENLSEQMSVRVNYVGRGGISSFAVSAVDIALWDIRCKKAGQPLWKYLGGFDNKVNCYYGGIDLGFSQDELLANIENQLSSGHNAIKIKLGKKDLAEDIERVRAVRKLIGPKRVFMVDANASWDIPTSLRAAKAFSDLDLFWLEEPLDPRYFDGYKELTRRIDIPIAMGENLHSLNQHLLAMMKAGVSYPQPDASNSCGITGWLRVANLAKAFHKPVCSHGMQELHVSLLAAMPHAGYMEIHSFPIDQYTKNIVKVKNGIALAPDTVGIGVEFDIDLLSSYKVL